MLGEINSSDRRLPSIDSSYIIQILYISVLLPVCVAPPVRFLFQWVLNESVQTNALI